MPIKDLQRKDKPGLTRAGVIRLGYKVKRCNKCKAVNLAPVTECHACKGKAFGKEYPTPSDHFVLTDAPGVVEAIKDPKPIDLRIYFPFDDIDLNFPAFHQLWSASSLICRGDGEHVLYAIHPQKGETIVRDGRAMTDYEITAADDHKLKINAGQEVGCPGMTHDLYAMCQHCKPNAMLIVLLRDVPRLAYYQIATTSIHNVINLTEQMTYIKQTIRRLVGVPFILKLRPQKISVPKGGNGRMRTEKYLLSLEVDPEWFHKLEQAQNRLADPTRVLLSEQVPEDDKIIEVEPVRSVAVPALPLNVEPPIWFPPNGGDDSNEDFTEDDKVRFCDRVIEHIPYYETQAHVEMAMAELEIIYDPENEDFIYDTLAQHASNQVDQKADTESQPSLI